MEIATKIPARIDEAPQHTIMGRMEDMNRWMELDGKNITQYRTLQTSISISKNSGERGGLMIRILKAAALYFAIVFSVGFVLGTMRTLWLVPRLGARTAELLEIFAMLVVVVFAARLAVRQPVSTLH